MNVGDTVIKISGKPFQNKMKEAVIESFSSMTIPTNPIFDGKDADGKDIFIRKLKTVPSVTLVGCKGDVRLSQLCLKG